ncbi:MAG: GldG family protein [Oscillospiraceae bacterium]|nr:GldG family protein [Oscillospiraceae bacterium]
MNKNFFKEQRFKYGAMSIGMTVLFILAVILLNVVVSKIVERADIKIDLTKEQVYEVTDQTKEYLATLDKDIKITVFMEERALNDMGLEGKSIVEVLNKYKQYSDRITIQYANIQTNPEIFTQYSNLYKGDLSNYIAVVSCGNKIKPLSQGDLIDYTVNASGSMDSANTTEQAVTSAIMNVIDDKTIKAAILNGKSYFYITDLTEMMIANGYEIEEVDVTMGKIPEDATMLILNTPVTDLSPDMADKVEAFLYNDGNYGKTLFYIGCYKQGEMTNVNNLLAAYGLQVSPGRLLDLDTSNLMSTGTSYAIRSFEYNDRYSENLQNKDLPVLMPTPSPVDVLWDVKDTRETQVLLSTAETGVVIPNDADTSTLDPTTLERKKQPVMAVGSKFDSMNAVDRKGSHVLVLTSPEMLMAPFFDYATLNNAEYIFGAINKLNGKEQSIVIAPKSLAGDMLEASDAQTGVMSTIATIIIPLAIAVAGVVVYIRRRHK